MSSVDVTKAKYRKK